MQIEDFVLRPVESVLPSPTLINSGTRQQATAHRLVAGPREEAAHRQLDEVPYGTEGNLALAYCRSYPTITKTSFYPTSRARARTRASTRRSTTYSTTSG